MVLSRGETKKNSVRLTAKQEKKPQSTFQTLKQSLKLSNNKKLKQDSTQHSNDTNKSVKAKKKWHVLEENRNTKEKNINSEIFIVYLWQCSGYEFIRSHS